MNQRISSGTSLLPVRPKVAFHQKISSLFFTSSPFTICIFSLFPVIISPLHTITNPFSDFISLSFLIVSSAVVIESLAQTIVILSGADMTRSPLKQ